MKISVVIACYNAEPFIAEAVESALAQDLSPGEILIVDDGSTDASMAALAPYAGKLKIIHQPNGGIAAARNTGLAHATGDIIAFLDADDVWPHSSLSDRVAALADADGVFGLVEQFDHQDGVAGLIAAANEPAVAGRLAGATLLRGDAFTRVGAFDTSLKIGETLDWMARLDAAGGRLNLVDKLVLRRRVHANNTVKRLRAAQADYLKLLKSGLDRRRSQTNPTP